MAGCTKKEQVFEYKEVNGLVKEKSGVYFVARNNMKMICPFRQPIISQQIVEEKFQKTLHTEGPQIVDKISNSYCGTWCPKLGIKMESAEGKKQILVARTYCGQANSIEIHGVHEVATHTPNPLTKA